MAVRLYCCTIKTAGLIPPAPELAPDGAKWSEISTDWYGKKLTCPLRFRLELYQLSPGLPDLFVARFQLPIAPQKRTDAAPGSFVEGLWNFDAAELFLLDAAGTRYLEFNLSPYGEWWSCSFTGYRAGRAPLPALGVRTNSRIYEDGWSGELHIPVCGLQSAGLSPAGLKLHVSAIIGPGADRRYLSSKPLKGIDPDFHRTEVFDEAELVVLA